MKLGKDTASLTNALLGSSASTPKVGEDCTLLCWTDRMSFKVIDQIGENAYIVAQYEDCYDEEMPLGTKLFAPRHLKLKNGKWKLEKVDFNNMYVATGKYENVSMVFGIRDGYRDPSF